MDGVSNESAKKQRLHSHQESASLLDVVARLGKRWIEPVAVLEHNHRMKFVSPGINHDDVRLDAVSLQYGSVLLSLLEAAVVAVLTGFVVDLPERVLGGRRLYEKPGFVAALSTTGEKQKQDDEWYEFLHTVFFKGNGQRTCPASSIFVSTTLNWRRNFGLTENWCVISLLPK